ncbi:hypothetical protein D3C78_733310 [compost metagenome]
MGDDAGAAKHDIRCAAEAVEKQQFLTEQQVVDVADPVVLGQVFAVIECRCLGQVLGAGVQRQAVISEFAGDQQVSIRPFQVDADFCFAVEDADKARHSDQFHLQSRIAFEQATHARGEEHDTDAFSDTQADLAQWGDGLGNLFLGQQCDVFHGFGMFEQRLAGGRQFVTLGVLNEQGSTQALLDIVDVPGHGAVGSVEALGRGQQATAAL